MSNQAYLAGQEALHEEIGELERAKAELLYVLKPLSTISAFRNPEGFTESDWTALIRAAREVVAEHGEQS